MIGYKWIGVWAGCAALVAYGSLVPLNFQPLSLDEALVRFRQIPDLNLSVGNRADWLANLFLYTPLGFCAVLAGSAASRSTAVKLIVALALFSATILLAVGLEFTQLWFPPRTVSQNDVRAEVIGAVSGVLMGVAWVVGLPKVRRFASHHRLQRKGIALALYTAALLIYGAAPFDFVTTRHELQMKLAKPESVVWMPFVDFELGAVPILKRFLQVASFAPLGWLAASRRRQVAATRIAPAIAGGSAIGFGVSFAIEVLQVFVYSRTSSTTAILAGGVGAALGAVSYSWAISPSSRPPLVSWIIDQAVRPEFWLRAAIAYSAIALAVLLAPYQIVETSSEVARRWSAFSQPPFAAMYYGPEFQSFVNLILKACVFLPLGVCLRAARRRPTGRYSGAIPLVVGLAVGCIGELAQVYVGPHLPDITDVLIAGAATVVGWKATDRWLSRSRLSQASDGGQARIETREDRPGCLSA